MSGYKAYSQTGSGWFISTNPDAEPAKRWRAVHPQYGERFFAKHDDILPFTAEHMLGRVVDNAVVVARCEHCGGRWMVGPYKLTGEPVLHEGACGDCQADSDTEKPLVFDLIVMAPGLEAEGLQDIPPEWLA